MKWYYTTGPVHTRVRVFIGGANCGDLCFRHNEFDSIQAEANAPGVNFIEFIDETVPPRSINNPDFIRHCGPEGAPDV